MSPDKRERLINSALEEFGKNSYEKASTNTIVQNAKISKGLLYHHFKTKQSLFDYLIVFSISTLTDAIIKEINWNEKDLINRLYQITLIKLKVLERYPHILTFSKAMYYGKNFNEIKEMLEKFVPNMYYEVYHKNIDFSLFRDGIDPKKAIQITQWTLEKYSEEEIVNKYTKTDKDYDFNKIVNELDSYLKMLKLAFYK